MCCFTGPAEVSQTRIYAGTAQDPNNGHDVHFLAYQNGVTGGTLRREPHWGTSAVLRAARDQVALHEPHGNAMLLHIPAVPHTMTADNFIDPKEAKRFLHKMQDALEPSRPVMRGGPVFIGATNRVQRFQVGAYDCLLADNPLDLPAALNNTIMDPRKKPRLNPEIFAWYAEQFPDWSMTVACFDDTTAFDAEPICLWYEPRYSHILFAPGLDAHDGRPPQLRDQVQVDHWLMFGTTSPYQIGKEVKYTGDVPPELAHFLPRRVVGEKQLDDHAINGDFVASVASVTAGRPEIRRRQPSQFAALVS